MKTCLLSTVIVLLFVSMHAQQHVPVPLSREARHRQQIKDLIALSSAHTQQALKHRGNSRLVAMATNNIVTPAPPTYEPYDSTQYYYTGGYGYDPTSDLFSDYQIETPLYETYKNYFDMSKNWLYDMSMSSYSLYDSVGCLFTTNHKRTREHTKYFPFPGYFNTNYTYDAMERIDVQ
ncbi:MAG TPA: hypothetical protein PLP34_08545, partial [Chitinophagaceae bacterium]|nr:hypothetical protein [Chitinophagaceae bacterium]